MNTSRTVTIVLGAQWGDEGKGKLIDYLAPNFNIVARCQGGNNAGHTVMTDGARYSFHILPSSIIRPDITSVIGNGCVIHVDDLFNEIANMEKMGVKDIEKRLLISDRAHLVTNLHKAVDCRMEEDRGKKCIGTTKKGIGPCYSSKAARIGIRICDLVYGDSSDFATKLDTLYEYFNTIVPYNRKNLEVDLENHLKRKIKISELVCDVSNFLNNAIMNGQTVLVEGANGSLLDLDFGTYPYVTSSSCCVGGACTGLGISPLSVREVIGVIKAYTTRVGDGPFPTENKGEIGNLLREKGKEFGVTTGRPRRCGWLDAIILKHSMCVNGFTAVNLTKLDVLNDLAEIQVGTSYWYEGTQYFIPPSSEEIFAKMNVKYTKFEGWQCDISHCQTYEELPKQARVYIEFIETLLQVPICWIGVGQERNQMIARR